MKKELIIIPILLILGSSIFGGLYFNAHPLVTQPALTNSDIGHPMVTVSLIYRYMEQSDWQSVKELVAPTVWEQWQESGFRERWQEMVNEDASLDYVSFAVMNWRKDNDEQAKVTGRAIWVSAQQLVPDITQTLTLKRQGSSWIVAEAEFFPMVDQVSTFFSGWSDASGNNQGLDADKDVAAVMAQQRAKASNHFIIEDFAVSDQDAWVKGRLVTDGTASQEVTAQLQRRNGKWYIANIVGLDAEK